MKNVMVKAWEIAKAAVVKFGGKAKEYFAMSLKLAWTEVKTAAPKTIGRFVVVQEAGETQTPLIPKPQVVATPEQTMDAFIAEFNKNEGAESDVKAVKWAKGDKLRIYFNFADFRGAKVFVDFDRKCNNITTAETRASKYTSITNAINAFVNEMNSKFYTGNCGWI